MTGPLTLLGSIATALALLGGGAYAFGPGGDDASVEACHHHAKECHDRLRTPCTERAADDERCDQASCTSSRESATTHSYSCEARMCSKDPSTGAGEDRAECTQSTCGHDRCEEAEVKPAEEPTVRWPI